MNKRQLEKQPNFEGLLYDRPKTASASIDSAEKPKAAINPSDPLETFIPAHLLRLMNEGYVLWFHDNYRSRSDSPKQGEQFWIENGELHHKTVRMYKSKEISKGERAQRKFESKLSTYSSESNVELTVGDETFRWINVERLGKTLREELRKRLKIPYLPDTHSYYDLIDDISPTTVISFHKRKITKTEVFDAKKAKISVFGWLLKKYPDALIIPEFGIGGGGWGKTSIVDMAAFDTKRMIFVEIKAENDTYARVAKQLEISAKNADEVWLAIYEAKTIPKEIHENVGVLSLSRNGKTKIIRKAKSFKHSGNWIGHIWTTEWHDAFSCYRGVSKWLKNQKDGLAGLEKTGLEILGKNARKFTIAVWRARYYKEFFYRRDSFLSGTTEAVHTKRGMNNSDYYDHFKNNYGWNSDQQIIAPSLMSMAVKKWNIPDTTVYKHPSLIERLGIKEKRETL